MLRVVGRLRGVMMISVVLRTFWSLTAENLERHPSVRGVIST
jgi:hypothetical protein